MNGAPLIIGHRGASIRAPENTLVAFERALQDGAEGIEFDVRLARDRVPVVIHDANLRRTAHRDEAVAQLTSIELGEIDVGTWFNLQHPSLARREYTRARLPSLAQAFELLGGSGALLYVEMKCALKECDALAFAVAELIRAHSLFDRVIVESFTLDAIREIKRIDPNIRTAALFERKLARPVPSARWMFEQAARCEADEIALHHTLATRRRIEEARRRNMNTVLWTVDSPSWIKRARMYGVHAIITNNPALMRAQRDEMTNSLPHK